jgi:hypothetical protein
VTEKAWSTLFALVVALFSVSALAWTWRLATSSIGAIDYCYVEHTFVGTPQPYWMVYGHVPWHRDVVITRTVDFAEAIRVRDSQCAMPGGSDASR